MHQSCLLVNKRNIVCSGPCFGVKWLQWPVQGFWWSFGDTSHTMGWHLSGGHWLLVALLDNFHVALCFLLGSLIHVFRLRAWCIPPSHTSRTSLMCHSFPGKQDRSCYDLHATHSHDHHKSQNKILAEAISSHHKLNSKSHHVTMSLKHAKSSDTSHK